MTGRPNPSVVTRRPVSASRKSPRRYAGVGTVTGKLVTWVSRILLEIKEEERFVMAVIHFRRYQTTEAKAPIVTPFAAAQQMSVSVVDKWPTGVQGLVDKIVVNASMELIGPRPHRHVEQTTT